jgi:hypothetical protein
MQRIMLFCALHSVNIFFLLLPFIFLQVVVGPANYFASLTMLASRAAQLLEQPF